jgi:hypothetical protein
MTDVIEIIHGKQAASRALLSVYLTLVSCFAYFMTLKIEVTCSSEMLVKSSVDYKAIYLSPPKFPLFITMLFSVLLHFQH